QGYLVESSVAPLLYETHKQGPDFVDAPLAPYFLSYDSATRPGSSQLLELPISAALNRSVPPWLQRWYGRVPSPYMTKRILRLLGRLGQWLRARGDDVSFVAHAPSQTTNTAAPLAGEVSWIPRRDAAGGLARWLRADALRLARAVKTALDERAAQADLIHLHSNGLIIEVAAAWARRRRTPYVLTL